MTKKHFEKIAEAIKNDLPKAFDYPYWEMANTTYRDELVVLLADIFGEINQRFDRKKFMRACGTDDESPILSDKSEQIMGVWLTK